MRLTALSGKFGNELFHFRIGIECAQQKIYAI